MSKISKHRITCPACGHRGEFTRMDSINVDLNPNLREYVVTGKIFRWICPHCGNTFMVPYQTLYHDMTRDFMVWYIPVRPEEGGGLSFQGVNGLNNGIDGYRYRCTYDILDFQEKIIQLESGLNDCAIEVMKHVMLYNHPVEGLPDNTEFRFGGIFKENRGDHSLYFNCLSDLLDKSLVVHLPFSAYEDLTKDPMVEKLFEQDADFMEVSQSFLKQFFNK